MTAEQVMAAALFTFAIVVSWLGMRGLPKRRAK
jgi:hypothetical protein